MIVEGKFGFIHIPKTGGSFVRAVVERNFSSDGIYYFKREKSGLYSQHHTFREVPQGMNTLPMLSFVRNPWSWYVSWYTYHMQSKKRGLSEVFPVWSNNYSNNFKQTVMNALPIYSIRVLRFVTDEVGRSFDFSDFPISRMPSLPSNLSIKDYSNLRQELHDFLRIYGNDDAALDALNYPRVNISGCNPYQAYYDDELRGAVYEMNKTVIEFFSFRF